MLTIISFLVTKDLATDAINSILGLILYIVVFLLISAYCDYSASKHSPEVINKIKTYNPDYDEEDEEDYLNQMTYDPSWDDAWFEKHSLYGIMTIIKDNYKNDLKNFSNSTSSIGSGVV